MALPNSGITTTIVGKEIGSSSRKVSVLCKHPNVNKWSKYKPVKFNEVSTIGKPDWWKADNGGCGLIISEFTTLSDLENYYDITPDDEIWKYQKPTGTASSPFRIGDFRQYDKEAEPALVAQHRESSYDKSNLTMPVGLNIRATSDTEISLDLISAVSGDLSDRPSFALKNGYLGILLIGKNRKNMTTASPLGDGTTVYVDIPLNDMTIGDYTCYMYISKTSKTSLSSVEYSGNYVPIPYGKFNVEIKDSDLIVYLDVEKVSSTRFDWTLTIINNTSFDLSLNNTRIVCRYADNVPTSLFEMDEDFINIPYQIVNRGDTYTRSGTFWNKLTQLDTRGGYIAFTNPYNESMYRETDLIEEGEIS